MSNANTSSRLPSPEPHIRFDKEIRSLIGALVDLMREQMMMPGVRAVAGRWSIERSNSLTKLQEAKYWLGEDLAAIAREHPEYLESKPVVSMENAGRAAYEIYCRVLAGSMGSDSTFLPQWEDMSPLQRDEWVHAAMSSTPSIANPYPLSTDPSSLAIHHPAE